MELTPRLGAGLGRHRSPMLTVMRTFLIGQTLGHEMALEKSFFCISY